jgi:hypothetical protein
VDPPSALYQRFNTVCLCLQQRRTNLKRHRYDITLAEGIGLDRVTHNSPSDSIVSTKHTSRQIRKHRHGTLAVSGGRVVGLARSAMNVVGAVHAAIWTKLRWCTIICDTGQLARTRFWNRDFILSWGLNGPEMKIEYRLPTRFLFRPAHKVVKKSLYILSLPHTSEYTYTLRKSPHSRPI